MCFIALFGDKIAQNIQTTTLNSPWKWVDVFLPSTTSSSRDENTNSVLRFRDTQLVDQRLPTLHGKPLLLAPRVTSAFAANQVRLCCLSVIWLRRLALRMRETSVKLHVPLVYPHVKVSVIGSLWRFSTNVATNLQFDKKNESTVSTHLCFPAYPRMFLCVAHCTFDEPCCLQDTAVPVRGYLCGVTHATQSRRLLFFKVETKVQYKPFAFCRFSAILQPSQHPADTNKLSVWCRQLTLWQLEQ